MQLRSWLCASSLTRNLLKKSMEVGADIAHFDLEDSVAPAKKAAARAALQRHLGQPHQIRTAVRINAIGTMNGLRDLLSLVESRLVPDILILPKVSLPSDLLLVSKVIESERLDTRVFGIIETADSLASLRTLSAAPPHLAGLIFGAADFSTDMGIDMDSPLLAFARHEIALCAKRLGVVAIDSPCFEIGDQERLARELDEASRIGFSGKIAIHPSQIEAINERFAPSIESIEDARRVVAAHRESGPLSIVRMGDSMIGPPMIKHAERILSLAAKK